MWRASGRAGTREGEGWHMGSPAQSNWAGLGGAGTGTDGEAQSPESQKDLG